MEPTRILLFEAGSPIEGITELKAQVSAPGRSPMALHFDRAGGVDALRIAKELTGAVADFQPDVVMLAIPGEVISKAEALFEALRRGKSPPQVLVVTDTEDPREIDSLFALGAVDYVVPPFRPVDIWPRIRILQATDRSQVLHASEVKERLGLSQFVGHSPALLEQIERIPQIADCDACVLISGETGTGKEICARAIHSLSSRRTKPFVALNTGAVPTDLVENELFGHESGAFTSASCSRSGLINEAEGGTLFLDEIDSLCPQAQVKLLRFLQEGEFRPLGAQKTRKADVRTIAASNVNLERLLKTGKLRPDLYFRINVLPLHMPALRDRREDIPELARHFLARYASEYKRNARDLDSGAMRKLLLYDWPGNVRELENVLARAVVLCRDSIIPLSAIDLPLDPELHLAPESFRHLKAKVVADFERSYIQELLQRFKGNIANAARAAQKNRRAFFQLMRKHRIRVVRGPEAAWTDSLAIFGPAGGQKGPVPDPPANPCIEL